MVNWIFLSKEDVFEMVNGHRWILLCELSTPTVSYCIQSKHM
jgi:hypothetical protein